MSNWSPARVSAMTAFPSLYKTIQYDEDALSHRFALHDDHAHVMQIVSNGEEGYYKMDFKMVICNEITLAPNPTYEWKNLWEFAWQDCEANLGKGYSGLDCALIMEEAIIADLAAFIADPKMWTSEYLRETEVEIEEIGRSEYVPDWMRLLEDLS